MTSPPSIAANRRYNTRLGLILFFVYLALYLGFVLLNAFRPDVMESIVLVGLNLAIVYGFGLIVAALVMALIYGFMCRTERPESSHHADMSPNQESSATPGEGQST